MLGFAFDFPEILRHCLKNIVQACASLVRGDPVIATSGICDLQFRFSNGFSASGLAD